MILPQSYTAVLLLMVLSLFFLGSWAGIYKLAGKVRYELLYVDLALGLMLAALLYAFTVGNFGYDGFNFLDDLLHTGKRQWIYVFVAGVVFNFGNALLMAAVSVSGLAVAFPMAMGMAVLLGTGMALAARPAGGGIQVALGCAAVLASIVLNSIVYRMLGVAKHEALARAGTAKSTRRPNPLKGIILALIAGLLIAAPTPLVEKARQGDLGLGPYGLGFLFACGMFLSSFVYSIFLMLLPVEGEPLEFGAFLKVRMKEHLRGIASGVILFTGMLLAWICTGVPETMQAGPLGRFLLAHGSPVVAALWGIVVFKEYRSSDMRIKFLGMLMLVLFVCGVVMIGMAPLFSALPTE